MVLLVPYHSGNAKGFRSSASRTWDKCQICNSYSISLSQFSKPRNWDCALELWVLVLGFPSALSLGPLVCRGDPGWEPNQAPGRLGVWQATGWGWGDLGRCPSGNVCPVSGTRDGSPSLPSPPPGTGRS